MAGKREALREELMVQEVILESLQGETFDDAEQQREDAKREISRLKRALKALPKMTSADEGMKFLKTPPYIWPSQTEHCMELRHFYNASLTLSWRLG